jgi:16S rRNA (uracil1498-N3)-methyltransferase
MPATPAWPPQSCPRLFVPQVLIADDALHLTGGQAHYLIAVMRLKSGDPVKLFDGQTGEWLALVETLGKRDLIVRISSKLRPLETVPDLWLLAAPIKKARIDLVAEKACELGVARYRPILTRRTIIDRINTDRLYAHIVEAAEQCGRTCLPILDEPVKLGPLLRDWPEDRHLFFADEQGGSPCADVMRAHPGPAAILIGPEGGFDDDERAAIRSHPRAIPFTLGPRILRAETATFAAVSVWMATSGDWF